MKQYTKGGYAQIGLIALGLVLWPLLFMAVPPSSVDPEAPEGVPGNKTGEIRYTVVRVADGDTITVEKEGEETVIRLIGIDAPELHTDNIPECFALESRLKAVQTLLGKEVTLMADDTQEDMDVYGRALRYVYLLGGDNFNEIMLREGFAREYTHITPYTFHEDFEEAQREAKNDRAGLWNACR